MKKSVITLMFILLAATQAFASATQAPDSTQAGYQLKGAHAEGTATGTTPTSTTGTLIGKMSKGVYSGWNTGDLGYAIVTMHGSGSQSYGTAHDATALYRSEGMAGQPGKSDSSAFDGWAKL